MYLLTTTNQIQRNTYIGLLANRAQYGLSYAKRGDYSEKTISYIQAGIEFCELIRDGAIASSSEKITLDQLKAVNIFSVLEKGGEKPDKIKSKVDEIIKDLKAIEREEQLLNDKIDHLKKDLRKLSDPYLMAAHTALALLRQQEGIY